MDVSKQISVKVLGMDAATLVATLAAIVESSDDAIISQTLDGIIRTWNKGAERIFGYAADEAIGKPFDRFIPPDRKDEDLRIAQRLCRGERVDHFQTVRITKDSREIDVSVTISPIGDSRGNIIGASRIIRDMTAQRRRSDEALNDSAARLRAVIDNAVDGIITTDEEGTIESLNPAAEQIFGYTREELVGQNIKLLMPEPDRSEDDMYLANYNQSGQHRVIGMCHEVVGQRKDGSTFPIDLSVSEVRLGQSRMFTGIVRDITHRKNVEEELLRAIAQAEEANKAKDHFLSILSHELRTPLTPVLAEMSFIEMQENLPDLLRNRIGMIRRNIETEARLVDDLLDLTRISRGKMNLHFEVVDAQEALRGVVAMLQSQIEAKSLEVSIGFRAKQHHVWADPGRLQQVFLNLLSNAVKFTPENGSIGVSTKNEQENRLRIEITDSGIGIEPEMLPRLFKPFEQIADSRRFGGLGLGLSIAKSLMDMHEGMIRVHSEGRGQGTKFTLEFATVPAIQPVSPTSSAATLQSINSRVLLVEDHTDTRMVMERLLKSFGCTVLTANCVETAIEAAKKEAFDLLISDIGLPDGTGLQLIEKLRPGRNFRSIALSGFGQEEDIQRSREAGFEMHLTKPINFKTLQDAIQRVAVSA
jgi:two-component system CheB/CheR fusion protein